MVASLFFLLQITVDQAWSYSVFFLLFFVSVSNCGLPDSVWVSHEDLVAFCSWRHIFSSARGRKECDGFLTTLFAEVFSTTGDWNHSHPWHFCPPLCLKLLPQKTNLCKPGGHFICRGLQALAPTCSVVLLSLPLLRWVWPCPQNAFRQHLRGIIIIVLVAHHCMPAWRKTLVLPTCITLQTWIATGK